MLLDSFRLIWRDGAPPTTGFKAMMLLLVLSPYIIVGLLTGSVRFVKK